MFASDDTRAAGRMVQLRNIKPVLDILSEVCMFFLYLYEVYLGYTCFFHEVKQVTLNAHLETEGVGQMETQVLPIICQIRS